jgi:hypothetical protein
MIKQSLFGVALALAIATPAAAQAPKPTTEAARPAAAAPKSAAPKSPAKSATPQPQNPENRYVPAIMQPKLLTVSGCLKRDSDWELTDATLAGQQNKTTYKLEGISGARLSLFVGKRIEATGALQGEARTGGKNLPRFEATAVQEATGTCP